MHNIAVILPQDSIQLNDLSKHKQAESKVIKMISKIFDNIRYIYVLFIIYLQINVDIHKAADKLDSDESKIIFGNSKKYFNPFETRKVG